MSLPGAAVSLAAAVLSALFTASVLRQFYARRKPHALMWTVGLGMFTVVALVQFVAELTAWTDALYRTWYVLGTSLVGFLGAGSVYLAHRRIGHTFAWYLVLLFAAFTIVAATSPTNPSVLATFTAGEPASGEGWADMTPRGISPFFTIPGSLTLIGVALYGLVRFRLMYNAYIAAGATVLAVGTGLARFGIASLIYAAEFVGIAVMFFGFLKAVEWAKERAKGAPATPAADPEEPTAVTVEMAPR